MHLRAHGTVTKFFAEIRDAPANPSLALCASTVLFVLSQDRLNMDLDRESLELMLNLLDTDSRIKDALDGAGMNKRELEKNKQKVRMLCDFYWVLQIFCMDFKCIVKFREKLSGKTLQSFVFLALKNII